MDDRALMMARGPSVTAPPQGRVTRAQAYREIAAYLREQAPMEATATGREGLELGAAHCLLRARAIEEALAWDELECMACRGPLSHDARETGAAGAVVLCGACYRQAEQEERTRT